MTYIMVDVEADGPIPGDYSMISFGIVVVEPALNKMFYGQLKPISDRWIPEALAVSGFSREETLAFDDPGTIMLQFFRVGDGRRGRPAAVHFRQQRVRLAIHQLVSASLHPPQPIRPQLAKPRFALQRGGQRYVCQFQTPAQNEAHAPSG